MKRFLIKLANEIKNEYNLSVEEAANLIVKTVENEIPSIINKMWIPDPKGYIKQYELKSRRTSYRNREKVYNEFNEKINLLTSFHRYAGKIKTKLNDTNLSDDIIKEIQSSPIYSPESIIQKDKFDDKNSNFYNIFSYSNSAKLKYRERHHETIYEQMEVIIQKRTDSTYRTLINRIKEVILGNHDIYNENYKCEVSQKMEKNKIKTIFFFTFNNLDFYKKVDILSDLVSQIDSYINNLNYKEKNSNLSIKNIFDSVLFDFERNTHENYLLLSEIDTIDSLDLEETNELVQLLERNKDKMITSIKNATEIVEKSNVIQIDENTVELTFIPKKIEE